MNKSISNQLFKVATKQKAFLAIVIMFIIMLFFDTKFFTSYNFFDLLNSSAILIIIAAGVTLTIISGGCDLSVGGTLCLSGIITIKLMDVMPMFFAMLIGVLVCGFVGFINGFLVVHQKTEPFIITLGMGMLIKGICQQITDARPVPAKNPGYMTIANGKLFGLIPNLVIVMAVVLIITHFILRYTQFGRNCYAIGGDYDVAVYSGINAVKIKWVAFVISGLAAGLAGVMLSSKLNSGSSIYGDTTALIVNCGAVVGGTSFAGGVGGIPQTAIGLFVLSLLENCMNMIGIDAYLQQILKGVIIVAIIWLDCFGKKLIREKV